MMRVLCASTMAAALALCILVTPTGGGWGETPAAAATDSWSELAPQIFGNRRVEDGEGLLSIDAPYRAEDAAEVPITLHASLPPGDARDVRKLSVVIDDNPSPLAATITLASHVRRLSVSINVRVDSYTNLHLVAELSDGRLYAVKRYVKAAGGCSAPALRAGAGDIALGTMRFRLFPAAADSGGSGQPEAQLLIRHPNFSGMQMDQVTRLYVPAHFIRAVRIWEGETLVFAVESGISIAENPQFRFTYQSNGADNFRAEATDSEDRVFSGTWPAAPGG